MKGYCNEAPTLKQVAKVAGVNQIYLGRIVNDLAKGLSIKLPERRGRFGRPKKANNAD